MKKCLISILLFVLMILPFNVEAEETVRLYLFHSNSCIHCAEEKAYLEKIKKK